MIKLYYTGAAQYNIAQTSPSLSKGGFISNSSIPNGLNNSVFTDIGLQSIYEKKKFQYIGFGLYIYYFDGEEAQEEINLKVKLDYDEDAFFQLEKLDENLLNKIKSSVKVFMGLGPISGDEINGFYIEQIQSQNSSPYYLTHDFKELKNGEEIIFENVPTTGIALWLKREYHPKGLKEVFDCQSDFWLLDNIETIPSLEFDFNIQMHIENIIPPIYPEENQEEPENPEEPENLEGE